MSLVERRTAMRMLVAAGIAIAGAAGAGGCSPTSSTDPTGPEGSGPSTDGAAPTSGSGSTGSTNVPAPTGDATESIQVLAPRDDLVSPASVAWDSWVLVDPRTIELTFIAGPAQCAGVSAEVIETDQDVTINLSIGFLPGVLDDCPEIGLISATRVALDADLGSRSVRQDAEA